MNTSVKLLAVTLAVSVLGLSCNRAKHLRNRLDEIHFPPVVLWAWERPEDLEFLDTQRFAVAFLAQTLTLKNDEVILSPRQQPLKVSAGVKLIAVTRIESQKTTGQQASLSLPQRERVVALVLKTGSMGNVAGIQIDFDAASSEREFYGALLRDLRAKLPAGVPLSMTALASFCIGDRWLDNLPVDEAVPMIFRLGADDRSVKNFLSNGNDFREPLCRKSYGIAMDEPLDLQLVRSRRVYVFNGRSWTREDVELLTEMLRK